MCKRRITSAYYSPIANCQFRRIPITCKRRIPSAHKSPITNYKLTITAHTNYVQEADTFRLLITNYQERRMPVTCKRCIPCKLNISFLLGHALFQLSNAVSAPSHAISHYTCTTPECTISQFEIFTLHISLTYITPSVTLHVHLRKVPSVSLRSSLHIMSRHESLHVCNFAVWHQSVWDLRICIMSRHQSLQMSHFTHCHASSQIM